MRPTTHDIFASRRKGRGRLSPDLRSAVTGPGAEARQEASTPWVTDQWTDRALLHAGLYVSAGVLILAAVLGGFPRVTHVDSGLIGLSGLLVATFLSTPHFIATVWLFLGNDALRDATPDGGRRFRVANVVFIALMLPVLLIASQKTDSMLVLLAFVGLFDTYHFASQDRGFLSIYRHRAGQDAAVARRDNRLMRAVIPWMALNTLGAPDAAYWIDIGLLGQQWPATLPDWVFPASHGVLLLLIIDVVQGELRRPEGPHWPKLGFMASALCSYALIPVTPLLGYVAARVHHGATYLGLSRHMVRHLSEADKFRGRLLPWIAGGSLKRYVGVMAVVALPLSIIMAFGGQLQGSRVAMAFVLLVTFHHYFVDAFIWRFKRPEIREGVALYI